MLIYIIHNLKINTSKKLVFFLDLNCVIIIIKESDIMKKVELHLHLDGSVRKSTVASLLNVKEEDIKNDLSVRDDNVDLKEYLTKFDLPIKVMQTKDNLKKIAYELGQDLEKDDVIYAEVRFAPMFHTKEGLNYDEIVSSVLEGFKMVNIKINLILCMMRGASENDNLKTLDVAYRFLNRGVVALDLAGDENKYKTKDYKNLFDIANKRNIPFTIHAGEADGAKSVLDAVSFGAKRIGHGVRILEDEDALNEIKSKNITLEVCPTSNIQTKVVDKYEKHPIRKLYDKNVLLTISTDNNTVSNITLSTESEKLKKYFDFTREDFLKFNINAVNAAFISEKEKEEYINILKEDYYEDIRN